MRKCLKFGLAAMLGGVMSVSATAQNVNASGGGADIINAVTTAVPFLRISPDARSGSMGDLGIGLNSDANGWFYNPAKMAFTDVADRTAPNGVRTRDMGIAVTYTPWLQALVNDIYLASLYGFKRIDENQTIGGSLRYFSLGMIQFTDASGQNGQQYFPKEFALDMGYARKLSDNLSVGMMGRFIFSDLATGSHAGIGNVKPGTSAAADISVNYRNPKVKIGEYDATVNAGLNISNLGAKITYTDDALNKDFIPTNLGLGAGTNIKFDPYNELFIGVDLNKLMVPTPDTAEGAPRPGEIPMIRGVFGSFTDASMQEELRELMYSVGMEYWYDRQFAVRAGYFSEHATKGNRKFLTVGLGVKYNVFGLDFSYLIPTSGQRNPLDNTLRFTLHFDFEDAKTGNSSASRVNG